MSTTPTRTTRAPGDRSRRHVLAHAAALATVEGLEGLSVGRLADVSGMPKSSVYQLFGSKEEIQLATVEAARESFVATVITPAIATAASGRERLLALCEGYLDYVADRVFPGGCFFVAAGAELGGREGRVHDRVALIQGEWRALLVHEARRAAEQGALTDPEQIAFELGSLLAGTNVISVLHDDQSVIDRARAAVRARLGVRSR